MEVPGCRRRVRGYSGPYRVRRRPLVPLMTLWFSLAFRVPDTVSGPIIGVSGFLIAAFSLGAPDWPVGSGS